MIIPITADMMSMIGSGMGSIFIDMLHITMQMIVTTGGCYG